MAVAGRIAVVDIVVADTAGADRGTRAVGESVVAGSQPDLVGLAGSTAVDTGLVVGKCIAVERTALLVAGIVLRYWLH